MLKTDNLRDRPGLVETVGVGGVAQLHDLFQVAATLLNLVIILV